MLWTVACTLHSSQVSLQRSLAHFPQEGGTANDTPQIGVPGGLFQSGG